MDFNDSMRRLDVTLYGSLESLSDTLSKCRVRIFYKGLNRNRTFISEDFAKQLIESLPYTPIKGIFNKEELDFEDHGGDNTDGRIYGVVPENPNFAWEKHLDIDGVEREYACSDVILYTALYPEAKTIFGKSQSMEIHRNGLTGEWKIWDGDKQPYYYFYSGHLLGLQALGDKVEPCFEGSAFFSLYKDAKDLYDYIKNSKEKEESKKMDLSKFKLSDNAKFEKLWGALNTSEDSFTMICDIYDDYAIAFDAIQGQYIRAYYTKDNDTDTVTVNNIETCYIIDVNEAEMSALNAMKALGSYADIQHKIDEQAAQIEALTNENADFAAKLAKYTEQDDVTFDPNDAADTTDNTEPADTENEPVVDETPQDAVNSDNADFAAELAAKDALIAEKDAEIARLSQLNSDIVNEKSELESFKKEVDTEKKQAILDEFSAHLAESQITEFKSRMDDFSVEDFKKEICLTAYDSDPTMFSKKNDDANDLIYKGTDKSMETGALKLLNKHKGGNK